MESIEIRKSHFYVLVSVVAVVSLAALFFFSGSNSQELGAISSGMTLDERFEVLSNSRTSLCAGPEFINGKQDDESLQGACCSAMDFHRYSEQVEGLKKYASFDAIPPDPYDIPVPLANRLLDYQKTISLTIEQQEIYDGAVKLSHEGGPCCCKCWRWYAFEGLAKYLITEHGFNAWQIAEVWDLEDGCGGEAHAGEAHA